MNVFVVGNIAHMHTDFQGKFRQWWTGKRSGTPLLTFLYSHRRAGHSFCKAIVTFKSSGQDADSTFVLIKQYKQIIRTKTCRMTRVKKPKLPSL